MIAKPVTTPAPRRRFDWLSEYLARLQDEHVLVRRGSTRRLMPAHLLEIDPEDWGRAAAVAAAFGLRWVGLWAEHSGEQLPVYACLEFQGDYVVLRTAVPAASPVLASHVPHYPAADRLERHAQDLLGLAFADHPDSRRWTRHQAWREGEFPLRNGFPLQGTQTAQTPADADYPFQRAQGAGTCEIPVGPVHAGIIEPGHFRFQAVGEEVLSLEERLGYVHKGLEKLAVGRDPAGLARLAGRVSGDSCVAHAWAACQAMERAARLELPPRAAALRALLAERERVANHLGDIGAVCNDVGFSFALYQLSRLRELWQRRSRELFGHRLLMDLVLPGGVARDLESAAIPELRQDHKRLGDELVGLFDILDDHPSLDNRLIDTGVLSSRLAAELGVLGYVGRASGQDFDVRRASPYAPYDRLSVEVPVYQEGDVAARVRVRMDEIRVALHLMDNLLETLPEGPVRAELPQPRRGAKGLGIIEGWRGEILSFVRFDASGRVARFFPRDPSWLNWPALERLILGNIVPDFPVCNKSVNGSYSGQDL